MHKAVLKNRFGNVRSTLGCRIERHELGLHVGRESGIRSRADIHSLMFPCAVNLDPIISDGYFGAGFFELLDHCGQRMGIAVCHSNFAFSHHGGNQEASDFDTVGNHAVSRSVKFFDAFDFHLRRSDALDLGTHLHQTVRQVSDFGFTGSVGEHGCAFGQNGGH